MSKLNKKKKEIIKRYVDGMSMPQLGKIYPRINISRTSYNNILNYIECPVNCFDYKFNKKILNRDIIREDILC